jgi:hypothetical protein
MASIGDSRPRLQLHAVHALRSLGLLGGAEWLNRRWAIAKSNADDDRFRRESDRLRSLSAWFLCGACVAAGDDNCAGNQNNRQQAVHGWSSGRARRRYVLPGAPKAPARFRRNVQRKTPAGATIPAGEGLSVASPEASIYWLIRG